MSPRERSSSVCACVSRVLINFVFEKVGWRLRLFPASHKLEFSHLEHSPSRFCRARQPPKPVAKPRRKAHFLDRLTSAAQLAWLHREGRPMAPTHASRTVAGRRDRDDSQGKDKAANLSAPSRAKLEKAFALFDTECAPRGRVHRTRLPHACLTLKPTTVARAHIPRSTVRSDLQQRRLHFCGRAHRHTLEKRQGRLRACQGERAQSDEALRPKQ